MKLPFSEPYLTGSARARRAKELRDLATEVSRLSPQALTVTNQEEVDHGPEYPANFTKGLTHNAFGILNDENEYACFVQAINSPTPSDFDKEVKRYEGGFSCQPLGPDHKPAKDKKGKKVSTQWRGWESPRAGHVYELQGPDAGAVGMAPAPRVGSTELAVEMAEVYGLAILRDVPFTDICDGGGDRLCGKKPTPAQLNADQVAGAIAGMEYFTAPDNSMDQFARNRRDARLVGGPVTAETVFRGSTPGAMDGPYISQFMLIGSDSRAGGNPGAGVSNFPGTNVGWDFRDGFIEYGVLPIDQRVQTAKGCLDYMTDWPSWLDVQNGAAFNGLDVYEPTRRFITTPRDLATYVHFDQLYEAYLNAALTMLGMGVPFSKGFPEPSFSGNRTPFATFGGPHILSLVCEIATRCLKAVRRQKFNYHRRARPEAMGGRLTLACAGKLGELGCSGDAFAEMLDQIPNEILEAVAQHNQDQNTAAMTKMRRLACKHKGAGLPAHIEEKCNLLLPMAFPEGSPMHPAYGAGHATVAGGCVTILKAFFEMFEDCDSKVDRKLTFCDAKGQDQPIRYVPNADGSALVKDPKSQAALTIQGELDKLAANISIGRNMAGVHYYSDYYDSARMGERVAVGLLMEQSPTYVEPVEMSFTSFDGDHIRIRGAAGAAPSISILDQSGSPVSPDDWYLRHVSGAEIMEDL
ncbi:MAG: bromoperoxidase [Pseudomonadota bacterium]